MKKFVFASVLAAASICLVSAPTLKAQDSDTISIKDATEFNAYQMAITQADLKLKASALENFLTTYPQSVVKKAVLDLLIDTYQQIGDADKALGAASRLLQVDPNNMKAIVISVMIKKSQCGKTSDGQTCDDAGALARKGLVTPKPAGTTDADWKKLTGGTYPIFHSALALDQILSKKDVKAGIEEYRQELMLFPPQATTSGLGLGDTLQIAEAYVRLTPPDAVNAVWFYARALNFAPDSYKAAIEKKLDYWYKKYHGAMDGLDDIKTQAAATVFPPGAYMPKPAPTPAEKIHAILEATPDPSKLALADKELVLAYGSKEDADRVWAVMKDQATPVPGVVIEASATVIKVAVTGDAKDSKVPDFIVNLKTPLADKDIPAAGFEYGLQSKGQAELDGSYDNYTQVPATATTAQSAQIALRDGIVQPEKKKPVPAHKPSAAHHTAH
jgi:tetratricopeptide (TPR) repeat protein